MELNRQTHQFDLKSGKPFAIFNVGDLWILRRCYRFVRFIVEKSGRELFHAVAFTECLKRRTEKNLMQQIFLSIYICPS